MNPTNASPQSPTALAGATTYSVITIPSAHSEAVGQTGEHSDEARGRALEGTPEPSGAP